MNPAIAQSKKATQRLKHMFISHLFRFEVVRKFLKCTSYFKDVCWKVFQLDIVRNGTENSVLTFLSESRSQKRQRLVVFHGDGVELLHEQGVKRAG